MLYYAVHTNAHRQDRVLNMTVGEVRKSTVFMKGFTTFHMISVWENTKVTEGLGKVVLPEWVFALLKKYNISKFKVGCANEDLVFISSSGEQIAHDSGEIEQLSSQFGKKVEDNT